MNRERERERRYCKKEERVCGSLPQPPLLGKTAKRAIKLNTPSIVERKRVPSKGFFLFSPFLSFLFTDLLREKERKKKRGCN